MLETTSVLNYLSELAGSGMRVLYFPNNGNAGDSLINIGFYQLAERIGLRYTCSSIANWIDPRDNDIAIIGGGGSIVPQHSSTPRLLERLNQLRLRTVILPQSIRAYGQVLAGLDNRSAIFCRDQASFEYCRSLGLKAAIYIDHDMAFYVDLEQLTTATCDFKPASGQKYGRLRQALYRYHLIRSRFVSSVTAARCDAEAAPDVSLPRNPWNDFSAIARFGNTDFAHTAYSARRLYELVTMYDKVITDRLHVGIMCALAGVEVELHDNVYGKCSGVYDMSMRGFSHVTLVRRNSG